MTHPPPVVTSPLQTRLSLGVVAALALLSLVAGCAGGPSRHPRVHDEPRQPPLAARADFFAGAITAEAQVVSFRHSMMHPDRDGEGGRQPAPRQTTAHGPIANSVLREAATTRSPRTASTYQT